MTNLTLSNRDSSNGFVINNFDELDKPSVSLSATEDINGDRISNLIIGIPEAEPTVTKGIVFIDPNIDDYETLKAGVIPGLEVVLLDGSQEGIAQITQALKGRRGLSSLHIVAHGEAGGLWLGSGLVNSTSLDQYRQNLQSWAAALAPGADILIYGCNVAAGETGEQFVRQLSQLTGADVAASSNLTGSAALGGDWELEVKIGEIEAPLAFQVEAMEGYSAVLDIKRVSVASDGTQGNNDSYHPSISADGRYVAFNSSASNLVSGDTNGSSDIFVRDLLTNTTRRVSLATDGTQGNYNSNSPSISADGRYVAFYSFASNLVSGDTNGPGDIFVRDLLTNTTRRVSVATDGTQGNSVSYSPSISADGRYVAFNSSASNLVSGDTNGSSDIFVRDLLTNTTRRVSLATDATQGNGFSYYPSISADGRYVAFESYASNLVSGDTNGTKDIFVRDLLTNTTRRVSLATDGTQGNYHSGSPSSPSISADGRYVAFNSDASNLVSGDTNNAPDIFVRDLLTNTTRRVSLATEGTQGNSYSYYPSISADGRYVAFNSDASNLVSGDTNNVPDIFVRDLLTNTTRRVSLDTDGTQGNNDSYFPSISADGRYVAFDSGASNLVSGDTNGSRDIFVASVPPSTTTVVNFGASTYSGTEGTTNTVVKIPITLSATPTTNVRVPIVINGSSTATQGNDYTLSTTTLTFAAGATGAALTRNVAVTIKPDNIAENAETVVLNFGTITGADAGTTNQATLTIDANDPISYAITPRTAAVTEGNSGTTRLAFTVTRRGGIDAASSVNYALGGTATNGTDYNNIGGTSGATGTTGTINFAARQTSKTITMNVLGDKVVEANETVSVTLSNPVAPGPTPTITRAVATTTIKNDDYLETPGDTLSTALNSGLSSAHPGTFNLNAQIGDNRNVGANSDVDMVAFQLDAGSRVTIDIDARVNGSNLDSMLRLFNSSGQQLAHSDDTPAPGETFSVDSYLDFTAQQTGTYYVGVSGYSNSRYNPSVTGSGSGNSTGNYNLQMSVIAPPETPGDTIYANEGNNTIYGGAGNDTVYAGNGNDLIDGGAGNDTIYANEGNNTIYGGTGDDLIYAGSGSDTITGGDGNDIIYAGTGDNLINGGLGNDTIWLGGGHDTVTLESGVGFDTINNFQLGQTTFTLGSGLTASDLTINDGTSGSEIYAGSDLLAVVSWTQASTINNNLSAVFV
jgi:Tol biopolymer transport system component